MKKCTKVFGYGSTMKERIYSFKYLKIKKCTKNAGCVTMKLDISDNL